MGKFYKKIISPGWVIENYSEHHHSYILTVPKGEDIKAIKFILSNAPGGSKRFIVNEIYEGTEIYFRADHMRLMDMMVWVCENLHLKYTAPEKRVNKPRKKRVHQYALDGTYITTWDSVREAGRTLGGSPGSIWSAASGKQSTASGFRWKFADDPQ